MSGIEFETDLSSGPKQIVISARWAVSMLVVAMVNAGVVYQQFTDLKDSFKESRTELTRVKETQIGDHSTIQSHEARLATLERAADRDARRR